MTIRKFLSRGVLSWLAVPGVAMFQLGFLPSCEGILTTFNPCGTVFGFCSEADLDLLFADIPDFDLDPTCTIPFATGGDCAGGPILPNPGPRP
jgi:hypothetical protein